MINGSFVGKDAFPITPSDTVIFKEFVVIECLGTAGNLVVDTKKGAKVTYPIAANAKFTCLVSRVYAATTATTLWAYEI